MIIPSYNDRLGLDMAWTMLVKKEQECILECNIYIYNEYIIYTHRILHSILTSGSYPMLLDCLISFSDFLIVFFIL